MRHSIKSLLVALALAVGLATSAYAGPYLYDSAADHRGDYAGALSHIGIPWNRVWVDRNRPSYPWRCHVAVGGTVYFSGAILETVARAKLRPYANRSIFCRSSNRHSLGW